MRGYVSKLFFPHDNKPGHFKSLDGLRGIAVLLVILSHSSNNNLYFNKYLNFELTGKIGVYLFFVLSAYLLDRQIALAFRLGKASKRYWINYATRRFLRIFPLFLVALLLYGTLTLLNFRTAIDEPWDIPLHLALMKGESIFWSIPVEFKYYVLSPLILWICHRYLAWDQIKVLVLILLLAMISFIAIELLNLSQISTLRYLPIFLVGTLISVYELAKESILYRPMSLRVLAFMGLFSTIFIGVTIPFYFEVIFGFRLNFRTHYYYLPYALAWGLILLSAKYVKGILRWILQLKLLRFIGTISFSVYLFHMIFLYSAIVFPIPDGLKIYFFFVTTITFSSITYLTIERPLSKIKLKNLN